MNSSKLKGIRVERGYNQQRLAEAIGITLNTYYRKESGRAEFSRDEIEKLATVLCLTAQDVNVIFFDNKLT